MEEKVPTGVPGLDRVLAGGYPANSLCLIEGEPGVGKTTLGLQFVLEGVRTGEPVLYITLSETVEELRTIADSHGWSLEGASLLELGTTEESLQHDFRYTVFHPAEVELDQITQQVLDEFERVRPRRAVYDSLSELRLLIQNPVRYRRQLLALKQFFTRNGATVLMLDTLVSGPRDYQLHSLARGIIKLHRTAPFYGTTRRTVEIVKMRGVADVREGFHSCELRTGGLEVFPRLEGIRQPMIATLQTVASGIAGLDEMLCGGLNRGTTTLVLGPSGTGKSALATTMAANVAQTGSHVIVFMLDENIHTSLARARSLGMDVQSLAERGTLHFREVAVSTLSPGELLSIVRAAVEEQDVDCIVLDGLNAYFAVEPDRAALLIQIHDLITYLDRRGVVTVLVVGQHGVLGTWTRYPLDISFLADTVILLRHFESHGSIGKAVAVVKKRTGPHQRVIREFLLSSSGVAVGEPLRDLKNVLSGWTKAGAEDSADAATATATAMQPDDFDDRT
jgi:circadian clock protein KaiC